MNPHQKRYRGKQSKHSLSFQKQVVRDIILGDLTYKEAGLKYNISLRMAAGWYKKYSSQIEIVPSVSSVEDTPVIRDTEIKKLQEALTAANMKIVALETMIDIAEESLKIDIRKKSGTKQFSE